MTMPRKKSRAASVDGREYRFIVQPSNDHGCVGVLIEDQEYPSRPMYAEVMPGDCASRGVGAPQVAALVRAGRQAGWRPETEKGQFCLDYLLGAWAIEDDRRAKTQVYDVPALLTDYLKAGEVAKVDRALGTMDPSRYETATILGILRVTAGATLTNRPRFVEQAGAIIRERIGDYRADIMLRSRSAL